MQPSNPTQPAANPPLCPTCNKPVPANEAATYGGRHEDCTVYSMSDLTQRSWWTFNKLTPPAPLELKKGKKHEERPLH